jgi:hypothetical protein
MNQIHKCIISAHPLYLLFVKYFTIHNCVQRPTNALTLKRRSCLIRGMSSSSYSKYIVSSLYEKYLKDEDYKPGSTLLRSLRDAKLQSLSETLSAINLPTCIPLQGAIGTDIIFCRSSNSQLFYTVRSESRAVLTGNAGTARKNSIWYFRAVGK